MSREIRREQFQPEVRWMDVVEKKCDRCHQPISDDEPDGMYAHELVIRLDEEQCVNLLRTRDYCPDCLEPIWEGINHLISAEDAWAERDPGYYDA